MKIQDTANLKTKAMGPSTSQFPGNLRNRLFRYLLIGLLVLIPAGFLARATYQKLCHSDFFQITAMKIDGNHIVSKEQIRTLSKVDIHSNLLAINISQVKSLLESHPWIAGVEVARDWPNRLVITVREKQPVALLSRDTGLFYLDGRGQTIAAPGQYQELDYPVITGLERYPFNPAETGSTPDILRDALKLLKLASRNNSILPEQNISEIHISENGSMLLYLLERAFPIYMGSSGDISTRYYRLVKVLKDLYKTKEFASVSYIRLDYREDAILVGKEKSAKGQQG